MTTRKTMPRCGVQDKTRFPTERVANKALDRMWRRAVRSGSMTGTKMPCRAYPCKVCKGWHLTSQKKREANEMIKDATIEGTM
jgi:hypothetical protein